MQKDPTIQAIEYIEAVHAQVLSVKKDSSLYEVVAVAYLILNKVIETYMNNEQLPKSSSGTSEEGIVGESEQVQGIGSHGRPETSTEGVRNQQGSTTKSGKRKRRGSQKG